MIGHPIVFISYSWDNEPHKKWVLELANKLRSDGVDVILDRYYLTPGKNLSLFVEDSLRKSNRIILVLTPNYKLKAEKRIGGVGQEISIINNELVKNISENERVIPILRKGSSDDSIPPFFQQYIYINFTKDVDFNSSYEGLLREIYKEPEVKIPELGSKPTFDNIDDKPENEDVLTQIKTLSDDIQKGTKDERKKIASKIYILSSKKSLSDFLILADEKDLNYKIAAAIGLKSMIENLQIDLGSNPNVRRFVSFGINHESSYFRYRIMDLISSSEILTSEFSKEIESQREYEENKAVNRKIDAITKSPVNKDDVKEVGVQNLKILISQGKIEKVLNELEKIGKIDPSIENEVIMIKARYNKLKRDKNMGLISLDEVTRYSNQINYTILNIIDGL